MHVQDRAMLVPAKKLLSVAGISDVSFRPRRESKLRVQLRLVLLP